MLPHKQAVSTVSLANPTLWWELERLYEMIFLLLFLFFPGNDDLFFFFGFFTHVRKSVICNLAECQWSTDIWYKGAVLSALRDFEPFIISPSEDIQWKELHLVKQNPDMRVYACVFQCEVTSQGWRWLKATSCCQSWNPVISLKSKSNQ